MKFQFAHKNRISKITILGILFSLFLPGCDAPKTTGMAPENKHKIISVHTCSNINSKLALSLDFVQVYDKEVFETVKGMDANTFMKQKGQLMLDHPEGLSVWTIDFIDNQVKTFKFPSHRNYWGIIIYLHFINNPQNRMIVPKNMHSVALQIGDGSFKMIQNHHGQHHHCEDLKEGDSYSATPFAN